MEVLILKELEGNIMLLIGCHPNDTPAFFRSVLDGCGLRRAPQTMFPKKKKRERSPAIRRNFLCALIYMISNLKVNGNWPERAFFFYN